VLMRLSAGSVAAALLVAIPTIARAQSVAHDDAARLSAVTALMAEMTAESRRASSRIRAAYRGELDNAVRDRPQLIASLEAGTLARLPENPARFNLDLRLAGAHPIAERDLVYQPLYVAARPATVGALLALASRVHSAPLEVTSLVRHDEYQQTLRRTNANANTEVPTHTLGLAFDISVLHMPLDAARELRDVLRAMSAAGDLFVIAETRQLVFHVVPVPERVPFFEAIYDAAMALAPDAFPHMVTAVAADTMQ
jgi:hypothetical protein